MINTNLPPISHHFRYIAVDRSEIAILGYPSYVLTPPADGFPWDDLRENFSGCQRMAKVPNARRNTAENLNRLSTAHERYRLQTDRQTTDGRATLKININFSLLQRERDYEAGCPLCIRYTKRNGIRAQM